MSGTLRAILDVWWIMFITLVPFALLAYTISLLTRRGSRVRRVRHPVRQLAHLDRMTGQGFEGFLRALFERKGFHVELTPASGDYGVDLILTNPRTGERIAVQAKRYKQRNTVGVHAIQEVYSGKDYYDCSRAIVVTTSYFTDNAKLKAQKLGVWMIDRDGLKEEFNRQQEG